MIQKLSNQKLLEETKRIVKIEKHYTSLVLAHLQEVENRKLYCELALPSLFSYCTKVLKYSEAQASVRVNAIRLMQKEPEAKDMLDQGTLNLSQAAELGRHFRENKTETSERKVIIKQVASSSTRETKKILAHKAGQKRTLKITLNERLLKKFDVIQEDMEDSSELQIIEALLDQYIQLKKSKKVHRPQRGSKKQRYIPRAAKEKIYDDARGQCEYHSKDGKRCQARTHLHYDHVKPIALGGNSDPSNLRILCFAHNQRQRIKNTSPIP